ncbi:hypothetical protein FG379_003692 [Cryptosporidium bovis]|uniref:uncharacterized protein n=1 Tax=Cryptosporidium bovis TaxID=310047 RepID=UPI00351AA99A|nr:hypothetical protein FG379_003692 [Cryptosporidium bovis]
MKRLFSNKKKFLSLLGRKRLEVENKNFKEETNLREKENDLGTRGVSEYIWFENLDTCIDTNPNSVINGVNIKDDFSEGRKDDAVNENQISDDGRCGGSEKEPEYTNFKHTQDDSSVENEDNEDESNKNLFPLLFSLSNTVGKDDNSELKLNTKNECLTEIDNTKIQNCIIKTIENIIKLLEMLKVVVENETPTVSSLEETQLEYSNSEKIREYFEEIGNDADKKIDYIEKVSKNVVLNIKEMISGELLLGANSAKQELLYNLELLSKLYIECSQKLISDSILGLISDINNDKEIMILTFKINQVKSALKYFNILNRFQEFNYGYLYRNSGNSCSNTNNNRNERFSVSYNNNSLLKNRIFNKVSRWHKQSSLEKLDANGLNLDKECHLKNESNNSAGHGSHSIIHNIIHHTHHHHGHGSRAVAKSNNTFSSEQQGVQSLSPIDARDNVAWLVSDTFRLENENRFVEPDKNVLATETGSDLTEAANEEWNVESSKGISISYKIDSIQNGQISINVIIKSDIRCKLIYLISILNEVELSHMWAPYMTSSKCIYNLSRVSKLVQQIYELPWPIGQRENIMYCFGIDALKEKDCVIISCGDPQSLDGKFFGIEIPEPPPKIQREKCNYLLFILTPSAEDRELITVEMYSSFYVSKYVPAKLTTFLIKRMTRKMYTDIANLASNFNNTEFETAYNNNIQLYSWLEKKLLQFYESKQKRDS